MPQFHLNLFNGINSIDTEGIEQPSLEDAKSEAVAGARDLVASHVQEGKTIYRSHRIEITDEFGNVLHTVLFGDIIDLRP